jgi:hypothetical protein
MATVTVNVVAYPLDGVVGFTADELTRWGWVTVLDIPGDGSDGDGVGTFPDYVTVYELTVTDATNQIRVRWELSPGHTEWFAPSSIALTPTSEETERITQAIIQKATRVYLLPKAALGSFGEMTDFGMAHVRPDYEIQELLYGLRFRHWSLDLSTLVDTDDVIRVGLQLDPDDFPTANEPDIGRAIDSAVSWVDRYLTEGIGIA